MQLQKQYSIKLRPIAPYNFELTVYKPAGWWWSTPDEKYENGICWTATRFNGKLIGLKLQAKGPLLTPEIRCTVYSKDKQSKSEKQSITRMLERALKTDEDFTDFFTN